MPTRSSRDNLAADSSCVVVASDSLVISSCCAHGYVLVSPWSWFSRFSVSGLDLGCRFGRFVFPDVVPPSPFDTRMVAEFLEALAGGPVVFVALKLSMGPFSAWRLRIVCGTLVSISWVAVPGASFVVACVAF